MLESSLYERARKIVYRLISIDWSYMRSLKSKYSISSHWWISTIIERNGDSPFEDAAEICLKLIHDSTDWWKDSYDLKIRSLWCLTWFMKVGLFMIGLAMYENFFLSFNQVIGHSFHWVSKRPANLSRTTTTNSSMVQYKVKTSSFLD